LKKSEQSEPGDEVGRSESGGMARKERGWIVTREARMEIIY